MIAPSPIVLLALMSLMLPGMPARTQSLPVLVGSFSAERSCTTFEVQWGRERAYASSDVAAVARTWGSSLVRECQQNFPGLRDTIAAALASAGNLAALRGEPLTLTGRLTDAGFQENTITVAGSSVVRRVMAISVAFQLRDRAGRVVFGRVLTKRLPLGGSTETEDVAYAQNQSGRSYSQLQREVAYAVARAVSFRLDPLKVVASDGRRIALNYGAPLVPLGAAILVPHKDTLRASRLNVTSAPRHQAIAESEGGSDVRDVPVGTIVTIVEDDDPSASAPVFDRVELPEH